MRRNIIVIVAVLCAFAIGVAVGVSAFHSGDFNRDGRVDGLDVLLIQRHIVGR